MGSDQMTTGYTIVCRAHIVETCYAGSPTTRQFGEDLPMSEDGTWDGASVVCDACYIELQPFTPSGHAEYDELPEAIRHYREQVAFARQHADPQALVKEAEDMISKVTPRTPLQTNRAARDHAPRTIRSEGGRRWLTWDRTSTSVHVASRSGSARCAARSTKDQQSPESAGDFSTDLTTRAHRQFKSG
jgi:hypothetical protein